MKKPISLFLILIIVFGLFAGVFLYRPQKAHAGIFGDIMIALKEFALDALPKTIARQMMVRLQQEIGRWAQGGFSDENKPFAMISWKEELKNITALASGRMVSEFHLTPLCAPIKVSLGTALGFDMPTGMTLSYTTYAACTLEDVVDNVEDFYKNPSIEIYGWDTWTELMRPNNNFFGSAMMAITRQQEITTEEKESLEKEIEAGQGIKNEVICTQDDLDYCERMCENSNYSNQEELDKCYNSCEKSSTGVCLSQKTKKLGLEIKASVDEVIGSDIKWLISADEITEMINLVFSGLFNKLTRGINGILTKGSSSTSAIAKNQETYGYNAEYKKNLTMEDISEARNSILSNILKSVQQISVVGYVCNDDEVLEPETYQELAADILHEESQHLYTVMEGVNLKPDFEVLDNQFMINNYNDSIIYGGTWNDIPFSKYPTQCSKIANKKCENIFIGLPYELNMKNVNDECTTGCHETINNYRIECQANFNTCLALCTDVRADQCKTACQTRYANCDSDSVNRAVTVGACSSYNVGNQCLQAGYLIDRTKNICGDCVKKYQESCDSLKTIQEKTQCVKSACGNYNDISSSIEDAEDFYNRCAAYETKKSCEVCLKEYFMPAEYCGEIYDFINRAFVKYPAYSFPPHIIPYGISSAFDLTAFYGPFYPFADCVNASSPSPLSYLPVGLTCRILPDFKFSFNARKSDGTIGGNTCRDMCDVTGDELKNIADNEPQDADCIHGPRFSSQFPDWGNTWDAGGYHPKFLYTEYVLYKKTKCCAAFTENEEDYKICRGIYNQSESVPTCTYSKPVEEEPWCYCDEGERPLGFTRTGEPQDTGSYGGDCSSIDISTNGNEIRIYTNNDPDSDTFFIGKTSCSERNERINNTDIDNDGVPDGTSTDAIPPSSVLWEKIPEGRTEWRLSDIAKDTYTVGVYHNDNNDITSGMHVCEKCNSSDSNYDGGYYDTNYDQCSGKEQ
jgi:hypothetical protein